MGSQSVHKSDSALIGGAGAAQNNEEDGQRSATQGIDLIAHT